MKLIQLQEKRVVPTKTITLDDQEIDYIIEGLERLSNYLMQNDYYKDSCNTDDLVNKIDSKKFNVN